MIDYRNSMEWLPFTLVLIATPGCSVVHFIRFSKSDFGHQQVYGMSRQVS
jgi:hypothetical protein